MVFAGSFEYFLWSSHNCHECDRYKDSWEACECELAEKLGLTAIGNPEPPAEEFEPYGFVDGKPPAKCSQLIPIKNQ